VKRRVRKRIMKKLIVTCDRLFCPDRPLSKARVIKLKKRFIEGGIPSQYKRYFQSGRVQ
jgi:hypothetical protein